jgi:hypothetical protein
MKRQLLCTFTTRNTLDLTVDYLTTYFEISNNRLFTYNTDTASSVVLIYNIEDQLRNGLARNTILVHRKKDSNTVYTINALNTLIQQINNGVLDTSYQVDWNLYSDKLLTVKHDELQISDLFFEKLIKL